MIQKLKHTIRGLTLEMKLRTSFTISITMLTVLLLLIATFFSVRLTTEQSQEMAEEHLYTMAANYDNALSDYKSLAIALLMDENVQKYLKYSAIEAYTDEYYILESAVRNILSNALNVNLSVNFLVIIDEMRGKYLYKGVPTNTMSGFEKLFYEDYQQAKKIDQGAMYAHFSTQYENVEPYAMTIYYPIYSTSIIGKQLGLLCMNVANPIFKQLFTQENRALLTETYIMDLAGNIVAAGPQRIGTSFKYAEQLVDEQGTFRDSGNLYIYRQIGDWQYYLVYIVELTTLMWRNSGMLIVLIAIGIVILLIGLYSMQKIVHSVYRPLEQIIARMDAVASGEMHLRIEAETMGEDVGKLALGFNTMMDEIDELMKKVQREQYQKDQLRFNMLQSQIQPHFLYNTLDCIHWQALAEGNETVSVLVKSLAAYYRLCLSKGKDIITLAEELTHIKHYLIIQNMRYDDIVTLEIQVPEALQDTLMPKMTLQPLIENAIYHGIKIKENHKGIVKVEAVRQRDAIQIEVSDTGTGMQQEAIDHMNASIGRYDEQFGYGVRNVHKRIELMCGKCYGLYFIKNDRGGVTVRITLPNSQKFERCSNV